MLEKVGLILIISYLLGSIPAGFFVGKIHGMDIRQHGSGNIGATNVLRVLGKPWGIGVFVFDALKGFAAVQIAFWLTGQDASIAAYRDIVAIVAAVFCVIGHSFPIWLGFNGGKGVATSAGALLAIMPLATAAIFLVWVAVFAATRYVSLASISAAIALPIAVAILIGAHLRQGLVLLYFSGAMAALVVWRHRANIVRLKNGTEPRFHRR